ncbi:MAG: cation-efflux pump [Candidatus Levybacteria bacterium CG_4_9_14_0_2_um_filter_35_21]|nr:MAG: cation-efflux pump [Candidatus Levybacteria bacterium CG22_combo_CG10-13_8_21_14_all_35_11]PJC54418.1 MAG: cation-efflux pump [Candidatus Levybacteria bacterium CG_4_9_14_0_2_um_filter_35_21]
MKSKSLSYFVWVSIAAAIITISLKTAAFFLTGSVGLLSDALESVINLVAAVVALFAIKISQKPPDEDHTYGHFKAEYFSSIIEGILIFLAAITIGYTAILRLIHPQPIEQAFLGILISFLAAGVNLVVGIKLLKAGKEHNSIVLEADAHHLFTDVWTSGGVILGVIIVAITQINILDPIVALLVAANIIYTGYVLIKRSSLGFMDTAIDKKDVANIKQILEKYSNKNIKFHSLRTRQAATKKFMSVHVLVPEKWSMQKSHQLVKDMEKDIEQSVFNITVLTRLETIENSEIHDEFDIS